MKIRRSAACPSWYPETARDTPVFIFGNGKSGKAAAFLAESKGHDVQLFDEKETPFSAKEIAVRTCALGRSDHAPLVVVSPGFPMDHPWCETVRKEGGTLIPELEFGAFFLSGDRIVITGSLGKTSMVLFTAALLGEAGYEVTVSGNIGTPVSEIALAQPEADFHIIEASSFQLESLSQFHPQRAVCLNLFPNHLDRHRELNTYAEAKARLFSNMTHEDVAVWPDAYPVEIVTKAQRRFPKDIELPALQGSSFESGPLRENLAMTMAALQGLPGLTHDILSKTVDRFQFPDHRLQEVQHPGMGRIIDDSKSTCYAATRAALNHVDGKLHLIMGGQDKDQDPEELREILRSRNPFLYLYGASGKKMQKAWQDSVDVCIFRDSLNELMTPLFAHRTDNLHPVVFSPGCASFDQFEGFASRGVTFQNLLRQQHTSQTAEA